MRRPQPRNLISARAQRPQSGQSTCRFLDKCIGEIARAGEVISDACEPHCVPEFAVFKATSERLRVRFTIFSHDPLTRVAIGAIAIHIPTLDRPQALEPTTLASAHVKMK